MIRRALLAASVTAGVALGAPACASRTAPAPVPVRPSPATPLPVPPGRLTLAADLDALFGDPRLSRAIVAARVDTIDPSAATLYARHAGTRLMPASNMKIVTLAVAAVRLGWDYRFETRVEIAGDLADGVLTGDVVVIGGGDPTVMSLDFAGAPLFDEWAEALWQAGVRRIDGRLVGDDNAWDDEGRGAGWAWDDLAAAYAAPAGALTCNENAVVIRVWPGAAAGARAIVDITPPGHGWQITNAVTTGDPSTPAAVELVRAPGGSRLTVHGTVPAGAPVAIRAMTVDNPTAFFVGALAAAIDARGIQIRDGAWDIDDLAAPPAAERVVVATRRSPPLAALAPYLMKASQNLYAETLLKTLGRTHGAPGTIAGGRAAVRETLDAWGITADQYVLADGSGLSRYGLLTADAIVTVLTRMWRDEMARGPFVASLPVAGLDGTLDTRLRGTALEGAVQAKTGTLAGVRALSGYLTTRTGERLVFAFLVNNFTAPAAEIDAILDRALLRLGGGD